MSKADDWWDSLPHERRASIHRWLNEAARHAPHENDPNQLTIDEAIEDEEDWPMEVSDFMAAVDEALARGRAGGRYPLLLTAPSVLGQHGKFRGPNVLGAPQYGYTRRQCRRMLAQVQAAARADAATMDAYEPEAIQVSDDVTTSPEDR